MKTETTLFVAVGLDGLRVVPSGGQKWIGAQTGREGKSYRAVAFGNGLCVAVRVGRRREVERDAQGRAARPRGRVGAVGG